MTKIKILFYGNCHLSVIAKWISDYYSDKFEVFDSADCRLKPFWIDTKNFAVWAPQNSPHQRDYYKCIHEKIKQADFFIFQPLEDNIKFLDELRTDYLNSILESKSTGLCLPNPRFFAYPLCEFSLLPYVEYIYHNISKNPKNIINYLVNENDPEFEKIIYKEYIYSMNENKERYNRLIKKYKNNIDINNFIENNWKQHLLFGTHNHPIGIYWEELITKIFTFINEPFNKQDLKYLLHPNQHDILDIQSFSFFKYLLPDIHIPDTTTTRHKLDENLILSTIEQIHGRT